MKSILAPLVVLVKWIAALLAVLVAGILGGIAGGFAAWAGFLAFPGGGFLLPFVIRLVECFGAAFAMVVVAYFAAPSHKLLSASLVLALSAGLAWLVLDPTSWAKSYGSYLPIIATYMGAILGFALAARLNRRPGHHTAFKST